MEQLTFDLVDDVGIPTEESIPAEALFKPDGRKRCPHCRHRLTFWGGRLVCLAIGCSGGAA